MSFSMCYWSAYVLKNLIETTSQRNLNSYGLNEKKIKWKRKQTRESHIFHMISINPKIIKLNVSNLYDLTNGKWDNRTSKREVNKKSIFSTFHRVICRTIFFNSIDSLHIIVRVYVLSFRVRCFIKRNRERQIKKTQK